MRTKRVMGSAVGVAVATGHAFLSGTAQCSVRLRSPGVLCLQINCIHRSLFDGLLPIHVPVADVVAVVAAGITEFVLSSPKA